MKKVAKVKLKYDDLERLYELLTGLPNRIVPDGPLQELLMDHLEELANSYRVMIAKQNYTYIISFTKVQGRAFFQFFTDLGNFTPLPIDVAQMIQKIVNAIDKMFGLVKVKRVGVSSRNGQ